MDAKEKSTARAKYHIKLNGNLILWETEKAYLFRFPKSQWKFWVGKKLIQEREKSLIMLVIEDMNFKLISDTGSEKEINSDTFLMRFGIDPSYEILDDLIDE